jgi:hypothetical protein
MYLLIYLYNKCELRHLTELSNARNTGGDYTYKLKIEMTYTAIQNAIQCDFLSR